MAEARELIAGAVPGDAGRWADLGAGRGTFARALARILGPDGVVLATDADPAAVEVLEALSRGPQEGVARIVAGRADFRRPADLVQVLGDEPLDGALFANALHFVPDPVPVLARTAERVRDGGRIVIVEYDRPRGNRWVPYPIPRVRLGGLARAAGLGPPVETGRRPSAYQGEMYCAWCALP